MDYDFEAPTFINFAEPMDDDEAEVSRYFDIEHEEFLKGSPVVVLPEGPRLPSGSAKKKNSGSGRRVHQTSYKDSKSPADRNSSVKMESSTDVKKLSPKKPHLQTPGKVVAALTSLMLSPNVPNTRDASTSKREREGVDDALELSPNKRQCISSSSTSFSAAKLKVSPFVHNSGKRAKWNKVGAVMSVIDGIEINIPTEKQHTMETRADKAARDPPIRLRSRSISKANDSKSLAKSLLSKHEKSVNGRDKHGAPVSKVRNSPAERFVSLAEATRQFHSRTPLRFRVRPRNSPGGNRGKGPVFALKATIPQSPALRVKHRNRTNTAISREQQEEQEIMEIRKNRIKPVPLPDHILKPLNPVLKLEKKPPTLPEPFKITEIKKKEPAVEMEQVKFTARPAPKKILQGPVGIGEKLSFPLTDPKSPTFLATALKRCKEAKKQATPLKATQKFTMKVVNNDSGFQVMKDQPLGHLGLPLMPQALRSSTEIKPFSFEKRDKEWMKKKEEKIKLLEEQLQHKPEFHAKPVPSFRMRSVSPMIRTRTPSSQQKRQVSQQNTPDSRFVQSANVYNFKARAPTVLCKKPFEPVKPNRQLPVPNVTLASEIRAKERELFDQMQMKRELEIEALKQQLQVEKEKREKEDIAMLRKRAVHKSNPAPNVKPFQPQPSGKHLTNPETPCCLKRSLKKI